MGKLVALKTEKKTETEAPASVVAQGKGGKLVKTTATQRNASFSTAPVGAERKETTGTLGKGDFTGGRESAKMPTLGERVKNTLTGAGKQYGAGFLNAAGMAVAGQGGNVMSEVSRRQEETLNQQIESLEKTLSEPDMTEQERADTLEAIENAKRQRDIYSGAVRSGEKTADAVYQLADEVANSGARDIETAKRGAGKLGQLAVDVGVVGAQMGGDIAAGIATGGGALVPMFLRSAGGAAQEARQEGASHEQQVGYGLASGALSVATEKISNVAAPFRKAFGGGILDKVIDTALAKMNGSAAGKLALSVLSEGGEEMLEDVVQPVLKSLYNGKSIGQNYDELTLSEVLYDGLVGGILGGVGGGVEVLGGRLARRDAPAAQETDALSNGKRVNLSDYATSENVEDVSRALNNGTLAVDALDRIYRTKETEHIDRRSSETVGDRRVNAFQFDHPEMHQYYREAAAELLDELSYSEKGGEILRKTGEGDDVYVRTKRVASERIARLLDGEGIGYADIEKALNAIINDHGQENFAAAKRVELLLDDMLSNGYRSIYGESVAPNEGYLSAKQAIPGAESTERTGEELPIWDMAEAQEENVSRETAARNMAQVRDAATALGKNGSRALTAAYNETAARSYAPQDAVRDFYQVYNAALNGKKDSNTTAPDYIRMAAQNAGERDARLATQAKYFGENAQLVRDENWKKAKLTSKQSYALDALAKVTGTEIRFADSVADGRANAEYKDGVITLALDAKDPVMVSAVHETIHRIRETAPRQYQELAEFVRDNMSEAGMEYNLAMRGRLYETDNIDLLTEETVADAFGRMLEDGKALEQFTTEHRGAAQRIRDALHDLLLRIRRALGDRELRLSENQKAAFRDLQGKAGEMEALFAKALETTQGSKNAANEGGEVEYGEKKYLLKPDSEEIEREINSAGLYLQSKDNNKNNIRIRNYFSEKYPDYTVSYQNDKRTGQVKVLEVTKKSDAEAAALQRTENAKANAEAAAAQRRFYSSVKTPSGIEALRKSIQKRLEEDGFENVSVEPSKSTVHSISTYIHADSKNGYPVTIKLSDHNTVGQRLGYMTDAFIDLTEMRSKNEVYTKLRQALEAAQVVKNAANEGGETKFSIKTLDDGRYYVKSDRRVLSGNDPAQWGKQLQNYINTEIRKGNDIVLPTTDGRMVRITERSAYKLADDKTTNLKTHEKTKLSDANYRLKEEAASHIDEIVLTGEFSHSRDDIGGYHENDIGEDGFNTYTAYFEDSNGEYYRIDFVSALNGDVETAYSIGDIQKRKKLASGNGSSARESSALNGGKLSKENVAQNDGDVKKQYSLKEYTPEEQAQHEKDAISYFGKTFRWNETGYLTPNGTKLDFSGRHDGGPGGYRAVDHRDIREALGDDYGGDDYSGSMVQFMSEGNIRISPESGGINLSVAPTKAQLDALSDFISKNRGEVILDIDTTDGRTVASVEYPRGTHANKVLGDIKAYFEDGTMPRVSELAQFRYSLKEYPNAEMRDPEIIEPVNRVTDKGKYAYLVNDFRENGYEGRPVVVYESPYGLQALTGSHRVLAAREAGIEIPTVLIENPEAVERLSAVNSDDELQTTARELFEEGLIDESTRDLLAREEELNDENYGVPYGEQTRYSRSDREMLDEYIAEYGEIPTGEKPHRTVRLPRRTEKDKYVSRTIRTVLEAKATPDVMIPTLENMVANGNFSYERYTDKQAVSDAESRIKAQGWQKTLNQWKKETKNEVSKEAMATGWALYNNAATSGDVETALDVLNDMVSKSRNAAQALQAVRLLKKQEPSAQLYGVQRSVENLQEEIDQKYGKNAPEIKVDQKLAEKFLNAETDEARTKAMGELYRDIGRQMPSRVIDKWNAWRYLAMLGNPRTHVRNIMGNAGFAPMVAVKNAVGAGLEQAVNAASGGKTGRTKAILTTKDTDIIKAARGDYANVEAQALGEGKYSESAAAKKEIEEGRVIFGRTGFDPWDKTVGKGLESFRKFNGAMLDKEDMWFSKPHYAAALAGYCKANGITAEQIASGKGLEKARNYAVREAQKATYRDTNAFSQMVSELGRYQGDNPAKKAVSTMLEGILPFRKTPANILVRGVEYSPIGMTKAISYDLYQVAKGNMEATEMLDHLSAGLTGTGVMALGAYMVVNGILGMTLRGTGGGDEDEKDFDELRGHQDYSLELPDGTSITLDWLAPEVLPLFVGANLAEQMQEQRDGELTMADVLEAISNVSDPLLQMSCLQSLNDLFDSIGYAASSGEVSALANIVASAATSYLTQAVPTFFGQIERTGENVRMTTYTDKNQTMLTGDMQYALGRASSRLPGVDYNQIPYIDAWGRTESTGNIAQRAANNFLNPAYTSKVSGDEMEDELERLYDATNDAGVLPDRAARYFNVNGERKDLTGEEYVKYATAQGQMAYRIVTELTRSDGYRALDDSDKAAAVEDAYKVAKASAKMQVSSYQPDGMAAKCIEAKNKYGIDEATFILLYQEQSGVESLKDSKGEAIDLSEGLLKMEMVYQQKGLSDKQRAALFKAFNVPESIRHYNKALVAEKLKAMRKKTK